LSRAAQVARLAQGTADWLIDGMDADPADPSLYHGLAGVVLAPVSRSRCARSVGTQPLPRH
jgi:hypothetical protein